MYQIWQARKQLEVILLLDCLFPPICDNATVDLSPEMSIAFLYFVKRPVCGQWLAPKTLLLRTAEYECAQSRAPQSSNSKILTTTPSPRKHLINLVAAQQLPHSFNHPWCYTIPWKVGYRSYYLSIVSHVVCVFWFVLKFWTWRKIDR